MRKSLLFGVMAAATLVSAPSAWAGHPQERHGFWIGFGAGYGSANGSFDCDDCGDDEREGSFTGFLKLGGTLSSNVLLGVESNVWVKEESGTTLTLGSVTGTITVYPSATGGFFLKGGFGASVIDTSAKFGSFDVSASQTGWGLLAGIGYDLRVGRNISLTPCVNYTYGKPGDLVFEGEETLPNWKQNVVSFELGITFH
jgi:Outer membrane protein beta-barrel domain